MKKQLVKNCDYNIKDIINFSNVHIYWYDNDLKYLGMNKFTALNLGIKDPAECIGKDIYYFAKKLRWDKKIADEIQTDNLQIIQIGKPLVKKYTARFADGKKHTYIAYTNPFKLTNSKIGLIGIAFDISILEKLDYSKNQEQRSLFQQIIDSIPQHVYWLDCNGNVVGTNISHAKNFGEQHVKDCIGKDIYYFAKKLGWTIELTNKLHQEHCAVIKTGNSSEIEYNVTFSDKKKHDYLSYKYPLKINNKITGLVGIAVNITDRKRAEELQKENDILRRSAQFLANMTSSLEHEFHTPLTVIQMQTAFLKTILFTEKNINNPEEQKKIVEHTSNIIHDQIRNAVKMLNNLILEISTISTSKSITKALSKQSMDADIDFIIKTYPFDDDQDKKLISVEKKDIFDYMGDQLLVHHVFYNLIKNSLLAIKNSGKGIIKISFDSSSDKIFNKTIFEDTSGSFQKEKVLHVFSLIESNDAEEYYTKGTGLGLPFCKKTIESFGGKIEFSTENKKYSKFILFFPKIKKETEFEK